MAGGAVARRAVATIFLAACLAGGARVALAASPAFTEKFKAAYALYETKAYEEAIVAFEEALKIEAEPLAFYSIGRCHHLLKRSGEAAEWYEKFLAAAPKHEVAPKAASYRVLAYAEYGHERLAAKDHAAAATAFTKAIVSSSTEDPELRDGLASALEGLGKRDEAIAALEAAVAGAKSPALKSRLEARLSTLRATPPPAAATGGTTGTTGTSGASSGTDTTAGATSGAIPGTPESDAVKTPSGALVPDARADEPAPKRRGRLGLWIGVGAGAAVVAGGLALLVGFLTRPDPNWLDAAERLPVTLVFDFRGDFR